MKKQTADFSSDDLDTTIEAIDITGFLPTEDAEIEITANGTPTGWIVTLCSASDPKAKAFADKAVKRDLHRARMVEQAQANNKKYVAEERTPDEARRDNVAYVVSRIRTWTPVKLYGTVFAFSDQNAIELLVKPEMAFALTQIADALNDEKRFTKRSATS